MKITVWGCRGSLPSPGPEYNRFGGNTSCVEVEHNNTCIILDGGSGIQRLGQNMKKDINELHILLTHLHIDHTMGLGFFLPLYNPNVKVHLWGPSSGDEPLLNRLRRYFSPPLFPVRLNELPSHPIIHEMDESQFNIGDVTIHSSFLCHPGPTLGFRVTCGRSSFAYMPDHEVALGSPNFPNEPEWTSGYAIAKDVDLLFHDAQYSSSEYKSKIGWGHSSMADAIKFATLCKVKHLALFHHDPAHSDQKLQGLLEDYMKNTACDFKITLCEEGNSYHLPE
ncbi:MAG: MBL fold metallo-hydrolase [Saprospiraceae bacterium]|nr:MBL fold metallo-hydrolase [Saprospiraceae bacterium]